MPKYYDKLPEAAFGAGIVKKAAGSVKRRVKDRARGIIGAGRELREEVTSYPTEGFVPVRNPRDVVTNILEGLRTGTNKVADVGSDLGNVASRVPGNPSYGLPEKAARTGGILAPYVAATVLAPEAAGPALTGQAIGLAAAAADRYERGVIGGKEAIIEIVTNVGPEGAGFLLGKLGGRALGRFAQTPEGREAIEEAGSRAALDDTGGLPKPRTRLSRMSVDERVAHSKARSVDEFRGILGKEVERHDERIAAYNERLKTPLKDRPEGAKAGGVYLDDILTVDGNRYPIDILRADAGETTTRPVISHGKYDYGEYGKPKRTVTISIQEAEVLKEMYAGGNEPSVAQINRALNRMTKKDIGGESAAAPETLGIRSNYKPSGQTVEDIGGTVDYKIGDYEVSVTTTNGVEVADNELMVEFGRQAKGVGARAELKAIAEFVNDLVSNNPNKTLVTIPKDDRLARIYKKLGFTPTDPNSQLPDHFLKLDVDAFRKVTGLKAPEAVKVVGNVPRKRAQELKDFLEHWAEKVETPVRRPSSVTPALRDATLSAKTIHNSLLRNSYELSELESVLTAERNKIASGQKEIDRAAAVNQKPRINPASLNSVKARLEKTTEKYRALQDMKADLLKRRAAELGLPEDQVPLELEDQLRLLTEKLGSIEDKLPVLPPSKARAVLDLYQEQVETVINRSKEGIQLQTEAKAAKQELMAAIDSGLTGWRVPAQGNMAEAAQQLREWRAALDLRKKNPGGIKRSTTAVESMTNFGHLAMLRAFRNVLGMKNVSKWGDQVLRDTAAAMRLLTDAQEGVGGRTFIIDADGNKVYGAIKGVYSAENVAHSDWLVDFVPTRNEETGSFSSSRDVIPGTKVKDVSIEYKKGEKGDEILRRYDLERELISDVRSEAEVTVGVHVPTSGKVSNTALRQAYDRVRQETMAAIKPLKTTEGDFRPTDQLNREVNEASDRFKATLLPEIPGAPESMTTQARNIHDGFIDMINAPVPKNKDRAQLTVDARNEVMKNYRDYILDKSGIAIDNPLVQDILDMNGDPVPLMMMLRGRGLEPEDIVRELGVINKMPRKVRGAMNFVQGRGFLNNAVGGINSGYHFARKAIAQNIAYNFDSLTLQMRRRAIQELGEKATKRPKSLRFAHGDEELKSVLNKAFDPTPKASWSPELTGAMQTINDLPDKVRAELLDIISREHRWAMDYPELFPGLHADFKTIGTLGRSMVQRLSDMAGVDGGASVSSGFLNNLMFSKDITPYMTKEVLSDGHPLAALADAAQVANNQGKSLREMLVTGDDLVRAEPLAYWNTSLMNRITAQVKKLAPEDVEITADDITNRAGRWAINSLDKWKVFDPDGGVNHAATKDLQDSLKQLEQGLNRLPDWKGLQGLSQSVASMVLSLDANIISVQGYSAIASKVLYEMGASLKSGSPTRIGKAFTVAPTVARYVNDLRSIMSDEGFSAWQHVNHERLQYYSSLGLSIGQESFIAGPKMNKMPFESLPFLGKGPKTAREFNDLQFNRLLLYMKVNAIDQQLGKAKLLRRLGGVVSAPFMKLGGIKSVADEMAGEAAYLHGQPEDVLKAAIRTVNNKLGGIDLNAQGVGQWRQAAEQIMTITPGFFRAQAGMFSTAATRWDSVEGWMAITGIAEEVLFAAGVATLIAAGTGNLDDLNLTDMTRADWMAVPFDDSYVPIIPRVGIPRLAARMLKEGIDVGQGESFDAGPSIQSFAQGRISPLINATLGPIFFDEDFLGRKYRDKKDRLIASLTSFMPIFVENLVSEGRETAAQDGWGVAFSQAAKQTPLQFAGKNMVPRPPIQKLDEIAQQYSRAEWQKELSRNPDAKDTTRGWFDLNAEEQEKLLQDPKTQAAQEDFKYYQERRQSPKEQQIEAQFQIADERTTSLRTQPIRFPDGDVATMSDLYDRLIAGDIDGDEYRKKLQYTNGRINEVMEGMEINLERLGLDLNTSHEERVKRLRETFKGADQTAVMTQLAIWDSEQIQPDNYTESVTVETPNGPVTFQETDWQKFQDDKDAVFAKYPTNIRLHAENATEKWQNEGVEAYKQASILRNEIEDMPRYRGLTNDQADKIDAMTKSFRDLNDVVRAKIGLPGSVAPLPAGVGKKIRAYAVQQFVESGFIKTKEDMTLAAVAIAMQDKPILKEALRGPEQLQALLNNPDVLMFYPYLLGRVPVWMRGNLPTNLQPQFDIANRYAQVT